MTIYKQLKDLLKNREGEIVTATYIKAELAKRHQTKSQSILLSDYCYNRYNNGIAFDKHLFKYISRSLYEYIGEQAKYTGLIFHKPSNQNEEVITGEWRRGKLYWYQTPIAKDGTEQISKEQILHLFESYIDILQVELSVLRCKATELRHLVGRIGEFYCALHTNGQLTKTTNQHGFDVISNNRKISVKTTAQKMGFVSINQNTFAQFDDLFVVQYANEDFNIIYYGPKENVIDISRTFQSKYEIEISKLKKKGCYPVADS